MRSPTHRHTDTPARALGEHEPALLASGAPGDLVLLDADLSVTDVLLG